MCVQALCLGIGVAQCHMSCCQAVPCVKPSVEAAPQMNIHTGASSENEENDGA